MMQLIILSFRYKVTKIINVLMIIFTLQSFAQYDIESIAIATPPDTTFQKRYTDSLYKNMDGVMTFITRLNPKRFGHFYQINAWPSVFSDTLWLMDRISKAQADGWFYPLSSNPSNYLTTVPAQSWASITGKPTIPNDYTNNATTTSGVSVYYLTSDKTISGTALYSNVTSVLPIINDANNNYTYGWTISGDKKTLTVTSKASQATFISLLGLSLLGAPANVANGTTVSVTVKGN